MIKTELKPLAERFQVSPKTLKLDKFMDLFIRVGGIGIVFAVLLIFVFLFLQVLPLFYGAQVQVGRTFSLPKDVEVAVMGSDEWGELPFFVDKTGKFYFLDTVLADHNRGLLTLDSGLPADLEYSTIDLNPRTNEVLLATKDGRFATVKVEYEATFPARGGREVVSRLTASPVFSFTAEGSPISKVSYGDSGDKKLAAAIQIVDGQPYLSAMTFATKRTLLGAGGTELDQKFSLSNLLDGAPHTLLVAWESESILVLNDVGEVNYLFLDPATGTFQNRQQFKPFGDLADFSVSTMDFLLGDVSLVFTNPQGAQKVYSLYRDEATNNRLWGPTKVFPDLPGPQTFFSQSGRNKAFLTGNSQFASIRYSTTESIRWESGLPFTVSKAILGPRYDRAIFLDKQNQIHYYEINDPHPQAGWKSYFGEIQYEGQAEKKFVWQSTGATADFEYKLSLVPLIIGTLKGTFYALLFAVPIALLAVLYTSQFLKPELKRIVKPTMEIMASLPSVVLGFLAALWLSPIISNAVPSILTALILIVSSAFLIGAVWGNLPSKIRLLIPGGYEFLFLIPILVLIGFLGWQLGKVIEQVFFVVTDPNTGKQIADFRLWFPTVTGSSFEQRNSLVVGFVMGFAVIPIIFTITEDAFSNVPEAFRSGSLALGASRWQTALKVVLPTASPGIFSALMIGLGRAVGETMIVVMATGNTPVTEFNIFTGMRTLSANIAVELPEAPYLGTLYRTLFLGALVLFVLTFVVNTVAEIVRQKLRDKYRAVE